MFTVHAETTMRRLLPFLRAPSDGDASGKANQSSTQLNSSSIGLTARGAYTSFEAQRNYWTSRMLNRFSPPRSPSRLSPANRTSLYVAVLAACAILLAALLILSGYDLGDPLTVVGLCAIAAIAERGSVRLSHGAGQSITEQSISLLPTLFAAVLFGPLAAGLVGAASMIGDPELIRASPGRKPYLKFVTYSSSRFISGAAAGLVAGFALESFDRGFAAVTAAAAGAALAAEALDVGIAALTVKIRRTRAVSDVLRTHLPLVVITAPLFAPVVAALTLAYNISPITAALFFAPALAAQQLFSLYQDERRLASDLSHANALLERANLSFAAALVATLDARDQYTAGHSAAVAIYSRDIAERMGLSAEIQHRVYLCGLVHDIGKIGLPPGLLEKPGALTLDERRVMQSHSEIGERILANVDTYADIARAVRHHHERIDGQGYPDGLRGLNIPIIARIIAVADAYNAMTSDRPYRDAMPSRVARLRLAQAVEGQFDTDVVAAFEAILAGSDESYRMGQTAAFTQLTARYVEAAPESLLEVGAA